MGITSKGPGGAGWQCFALARPLVHGKSPPGSGALHVPLFHGAGGIEAEPQSGQGLCPWASTLLPGKSYRPPAPSVWVVETGPKSYGEAWVEWAWAGPTRAWPLVSVGAGWRSMEFIQLVTDPKITSTPLLSAYKWHVEPASLGFSTFSECRKWINGLKCCQFRWLENCEPGQK